MRRDQVFGVLSVMALTLCAGLVRGESALPGELAGDWKASLDTGSVKLRLLLHVAKTEKGVAAKLDSVDQGARDLPVDTVRTEGPGLWFEMKQIGASYQGRWNDAAAQYEGEWKQGAAAFPLNWKRAPAGNAGAPVSRPLSAEDRAFLLAYLESTKAKLEQAVAGLTAAQWTYKPGPGRWSIAENVEHLVIEETTLLPAIRDRVLQIPLPEERARAGREQDERIIRYLTDRTKTLKAADSVSPRGTLTTLAEGMAQFLKTRQETAAWVRTTQDDLRGHGTPEPNFEYLDAYGYVLVLAAHSARHTAQIEEVKAGAGYPR